MSKNETLIKKLGDPRFMHAMQEFQTNPAEAMQKYKDNMEVQQFLHEFCGIMGKSIYRILYTKMGKEMYHKLLKK